MDINGGSHNMWPYRKLVTARNYILISTHVALQMHNTLLLFELMSLIKTQKSTGTNNI